MTEQEHSVKFKLFDLYDANIEISDPSLKPYLCVSPKLLLKTHGRIGEKLAKTRVNIVERLAARLQVPGHMGKKHKIITSWASGKYNKTMATVLKTLEIIQKKTNKNPIQVFVTAIENGSPRDEITVIEHAGARYPQAVDCSPIRRIDLALRWFVQGSYSKAFGKKTKMADTLANEIIKASEKSVESFAVSKKNDAEKQADGAR